MNRLLAVSVLMATTSQGFAMDSLSDLNWKNRVVLVFANQGDHKLQQQVQLLKERSSELADRDMVVIAVSGDDTQTIFGNAPALTAALLRREADIDKSFQVILVGKDGGIKLRSDTVVGDVEMFEVIDRMPMRKAERG